MGRSRVDWWSNLIIGSGLAASIAALAGFAAVSQQGNDKRCELAQAVLNDDTPNPYLSAAAGKRVVDQAKRRYERCMQE